MPEFHIVLDAKVKARSYKEACEKLGKYYLIWAIREEVYRKEGKGDWPSSDAHNPFLKGSRGHIEKGGKSFFGFSI